MEEALELGRGWFKCECGATWIKMPELAAYGLGGTWTDESGVRHYHSVPVRKRRK